MEVKPKEGIEDIKGIIQLRRRSVAFGMVLKSLMILVGRDGSRYCRQRECLEFLNLRLVVISFTK